MSRTTTAPALEMTAAEALAAAPTESPAEPTTPPSMTWSWDPHTPVQLRNGELTLKLTTDAKALSQRAEASRQARQGRGCRQARLRLASHPAAQRLTALRQRVAEADKLIEQARAPLAPLQARKERLAVEVPADLAQQMVAVDAEIAAATKALGDRQRERETLTPLLAETEAEVRVLGQQFLTAELTAARDELYEEAQQAKDELVAAIMTALLPASSDALARLVLAQVGLGKTLAEHERQRALSVVINGADDAAA